MIKINDMSCIILATPRTGSSSLTRNISDNNNLFAFNEPWIRYLDMIKIPDEISYMVNQRQMFDRFLKQGNQKFIVKCMVTELSYNSPYDDLLRKSDMYKIKLLRRDVKKQIASYYIATKINKYHFYKTDLLEKFEDYEIKIDKNSIIDCLENILHQRFIQDKLPYEYDQTIYYEDLGFIPNSRDRIITKKPKNYDDIVNYIGDMLSNSTNFYIKRSTN